MQQYAAACAKHYAANNIENGRETAVAIMSSEQTLREVYARHFGMIVQEGGVSSIMASYNQIGVQGGATALHSTQSAHLLTDILRQPTSGGGESSSAESESSRPRPSKNHQCGASQ